MSFPPPFAICRLVQTETKSAQIIIYSFKIDDEVLNFPSVRDLLLVHGSALPFVFPILITMQWKLYTR